MHRPSAKSPNPPPLALLLAAGLVALAVIPPSAGASGSVVFLLAGVAPQWRFAEEQDAFSLHFGASGRLGSPAGSGTFDIEGFWQAGEYSAAGLRGSIRFALPR